VKIGITGHQRLNDPSAWNWVQKAIDETLDDMSAPLVAVTSLAIGADQLLARRVLARGGRIHAVLPFRDIERTFADDGLAAYQQLLGQADVEVLDIVGTDEDAYLAAGRRVVDLAEIMIAVWDGEPAKGKGGTADIVQYTTDRRVPLVHIDPTRRAVHKSVGQE
jgi:hypothetical protein